MKVENYIIMLIFSILFSSCSGFITKKHLILNKGTSLNIFESEISYDNKLELLKLSSKTKEKYVVFVSTVVGATEDEIYLYAFKNDKLLYWGYPYMFERSNNEILREIFDETYDFIQSQYK